MNQVCPNDVIKLNERASAIYEASGLIIDKFPDAGFYKS